VFLDSATLHILRRRSTSVSQVSWDLYMRTHGMRNSDRILHSDQTILEENFTGSSTTPSLAKSFERNGDARSVCGCLSYRVKNNNKKNSHRQLRSSASASNRRGLNPIKLTYEYDRDQPDNLTAGAFNELSQIVDCDIRNDVYLALILRLACFFSHKIMSR